MALIKCKHCGGLVSTLAEKCPHCGAPMEALQEVDFQHSLQENEEMQPADMVSQKSVPLEKETSNKASEEENADTDEEEHSSFWSPWMIAVVVALAAVAGFLLFNRNKTADGSVVESMNTDSTAVEEVDTIAHLTPEFIEAVQQYDELGEFSERMAPVKRNGQWGFINVRGEEVISCQYDAVTPFHEGKASVKRGNQWGYIDCNNEVVIPFFDAVFAGRFSEGRAYVLESFWNAYDWTRPFKYIDSEGNKVFGGTTPSQREGVGEISWYTDHIFKDGRVTIAEDIRHEVTYNRQGKKVGYAQPTENGDYETFDKEAADSYRLEGLRKTSGDVVIPAKYFMVNIHETNDVRYGVVLVCLPADDADDYENGGIMLESKKFYYGYADLNGHDTFENGLAQRCRQAYKQAMERAQLSQQEYYEDYADTVMADY